MKVPITELSEKFLAASEMATAAGLKGRSRVLAANNIVLNETGQDCLSMLGMSTDTNKDNKPNGLQGVEVFVKSCCLLGKCYFVPRATLYDSYSLFCAEQGIETVAHTHFAKLLRRVVQDIGHTYLREKDKRIHSHTGICLKACIED